MNCAHTSVRQNNIISIRHNSDDKTNVVLNKFSGSKKVSIVFDI